jgi:2-polyprenyl-6-methoxyphenol hydroxylase-like FAD-dependent oxidoreductase
MRVLDVGIVGGGTAGCAAAIALRRAGHVVTIYERVEQPGPVGAGIVLQPTGMAALARLGLLEPVVTRGARLDRLRCETASRRTIVDLEYASLDRRLFGVGLHRGVLFEVLFDAARAAGATVELGRTIVEARPAGGDRWAVVDERGRRAGRHDLVIVADGAKSQLRDDTDEELPKRVRPYPWGALWFVARDPERRFRRELYQVVEGAGRMLGLLPTGLGPSGDEPLVSLYYSLRADRLDEWRRVGLSHWKREILRYAPEAEGVVAQITDAAQVLFSGYHDVVMPRWHARGLVYLGDAAHAMSPQLGQGANLALWDAMVLCEALADEPADIARALADYTRRRRRHIRVYQLATRWLTPFFQGDSRLLGLLRDVAMPLANRLPFVRRRMIASMSGLLLGPLAMMSPSLMPPAPTPLVDQPDFLSSKNAAA